jgi:hypothetical protein
MHPPKQSMIATGMDGQHATWSIGSRGCARILCTTRMHMPHHSYLQVGAGEAAEQAEVWRGSKGQAAAIQQESTHQKSPNMGYRCTRGTGCLPAERTRQRCRRGCTVGSPGTIYGFPRGQLSNTIWSASVSRSKMRYPGRNRQGYNPCSRGSRPRRLRPLTCH